jgi:hypothetical protein
VSNFSACRPQKNSRRSACTAARARAIMAAEDANMTINRIYVGEVARAAALRDHVTPYWQSMQASHSAPTARLWRVALRWVKRPRETLADNRSK